MNVSTTTILIILGFVPSIAWLLLFLKRDIHPEPRYLIVRTFLFGIIVAPLIVIFELLFSEGIGKLGLVDILGGAAAFFVWGAFIEEYMKYWVVKVTVIHRPEFDEPNDAMIFMITAGLGFAAIENILVLFQLIPNGAYETISIWALRFVGATLLHALSSAIVGYFLGIAWFLGGRHRKKILATGLLVASLFHLTFNYIIYLQPPSVLGYTITLLFIMGMIVWSMFDKLQARKRKLLPSAARHRVILNDSMSS